MDMKLDSETAAVFKAGDYPKDDAAPAADPVAAPAQEAKPEPKAEPAPAISQPDKAPAAIPDGYVPHGALHEERARRQALQRQYEEMNAKFQAVERKAAELEARLRPPPPDPATDPVGHLAHEIKEIKGTLEQNRTESAQEREVRQQREQYAQFQQVYGQAAATFTKTAPDFMDAYNFLNAQKTDELREAGYTDAEINGIIHRQEVEFAVKAFKDGINPAQRIYNVAKRRGYSAKAADAKPNPQDPAALSQKLDTIESGQKKSPEFSAGGAGKPKLTLADISALPEKEFAKVDWGEVERLYHA